MTARILGAFVVFCAVAVIGAVARTHQVAVRYGTPIGDPCEIVASRMLAQKMDAEPMLKYSSMGAFVRDDYRKMFAEWARKDGAFACWGSVLFGVGTDSERGVAASLEADRLENAWRDENATPMARGRVVADVASASEDVMVLLAGRRGLHPLLRAALHYGRTLPNAEILVAQIEKAVRNGCPIDDRDGCVAVFWSDQTAERARRELKAGPMSRSAATLLGLR